MRAFSKGLKLLKIDLNSINEEKLFELIDTDNDGRVRYNEFAVFINGEIGSKVDAAASKLRKYIQEQVGNTGGKDFRDPFSHFDKKGQGLFRHEGV